MLPRRLGARFAVEALFLVLLAVGAGLAHLRPLYIVGVMVAAWVLVALAELTAERIDRSPLSYVLPEPRVEEEEPEQVFGPRPEERTVVAPLEPEPEEEEEPVAAAPEPVAEPEPEPEPEAALDEPEPEPAKPPRRLGSFLRRQEAEPEPKSEAEPEPEPEPEAALEAEPEKPRRLRSFLRRQEPELEPPPPVAPRHVKLLPRRTAPEQSRASQEVAELFGERDEEAKPEETGT